MSWISVNWWSDKNMGVNGAAQIVSYICKAFARRTGNFMSLRVS